MTLYYINTAAARIIDEIDQIGTVTLDSGETLEAIRQVYDALTDLAKQEVTNYQTLLNVETEYAVLVSEKNSGDAQSAAGEAEKTAKDKTTESTNAAFIAAFRKAKLVPPITLTLDNGTEFLGFKDIEQALDIKVYFADAHAPWQRDSNENVNVLIRFFFPRGTDFTKATDEQLDAVLELINNRPRKCLGYLSPNEFINKVLHLA